MVLSLTRKALCLGMLLVVATSAFAQKKNVIVFIGDGFGIAPKTATRMALGQGKSDARFSTDPNFRKLALDKLRYSATITTHSLNSWITDSAPGAACYACGTNGKIDNECVTMNPSNYEAIKTIMEEAKKAGYAVGLVTTTRITHATPAVWASHIWERDLEDYIAAQFLSASEADYEAIFNASPVDSMRYLPSRDWVLPTPKVGVEVDVLLGGGARHFTPSGDAAGNNIVRDRSGNAMQKNGVNISLGKGKRADKVDVIEIAKQRGYSYVNSRDALLGLDYSQFSSTNNKKLLGLFRDSHCSYEQDRQLSFQHEPSLSDMCTAAIEVLKRKSDKGFILMVEGGRIDHLEHANCGGIGFSADKKNYVVNADLQAVPDDRIYNGDTTVAQGFYGSDYMIKEVLAYDYAVEAGRELLSDNSSQTLILATSDHECGGFAVVGLHDEADLQKNGTKIRTYANTPTKPIFTPTPVNITRGDVATNGWFPEYSMVDFQGKLYPQAPANGRRIVIAYGSNPVTNGNGSTVGGTPGNHTPQDILVLADDNVNGTYASKITGRGLLDNTDLTPIMAEFLSVSMATDVPDKGSELPTNHRIFPNPSTDASDIQLQVDATVPETAVVNIYNSIGQRVRQFKSDLNMGTSTIRWDKRDDNGTPVDGDAYYLVVKGEHLGSLLEKTVIVR